MQLGRRVKKTLKAGDGKEDVDFLTKEEVYLFLESVKKHCPEYYTLFLCAIRTGMRAGELIGLKSGDIDFNGMFVKVRRNVVRGRVTTPKSGESRRVDMSRQLAETLRIHLLETKKITLKKGWKEPPE